LIEIFLVSVRKAIPFGVDFYVLLFPLGFVFACFYITKALYHRLTILFVMKKYFCQLAVYNCKTPTHILQSIMWTR